MLNPTNSTSIKWLLRLNEGRRGQNEEVDKALDRLILLEKNSDLPANDAAVTRAIRDLEFAVCTITNGVR